MSNPTTTVAPVEIFHKYITYFLNGLFGIVSSIFSMNHATTVYMLWILQSEASMVVFFSVENFFLPTEVQLVHTFCFCNIKWQVCYTIIARNCRCDGL